MAWLTPISQSTQVSASTGNNVYVDTSVTIGVSNVAAITSGTGNRIWIEGTVLSGAINTIYMAGATASATSNIVEIGATGRVKNFGTGEAAIAFAGSGNTLLNAGTITSFFSSGVRLNNSSTTSQSTITNTGTIDAAEVGVARLDNVSVETIVLNNSGLIVGDVASYGWLFAPSTGRDLITNSGRMVGDVMLAGGSDVYNGAAGRLTGKVLAGDGADIITTGIDNDWIEGGAGADVLRGNAGNDRLDGGTEADQMFGGVGNDVYVVDNAADIVNETGGNGIDTVAASLSFNLSNATRVIGAVENLVLSNTPGALVAAGNALANVITGNNLNNSLYGFAGNDRLTGGLGNDSFVFNTAPNTTTNRDVITDFTNAVGNNDTILLENAVFAKLGAAGPLNAGFFHVGASAHDANDYIVYNNATGALYYDANGSAAGGAVMFAVLSNKPVLSAADFLVI